jgi:hypothetical protein
MPQVTLGAENGAASALHYEDHGESPPVVLSTSGNYPGRDRPFFFAGTFFPISALSSTTSLAALSLGIVARLGGVFTAVAIPAHRRPVGPTHRAQLGRIRQRPSRVRPRRSQ